MERALAAHNKLKSEEKTKKWTHGRPVVTEMTSKRPRFEATQVQPGDGQVFNTPKGGELVRNWTQELHPQPLTSSCLVELKRADEAGDTIGASVDCGTPFLDRSIFQGDPAEKVMSRSS